MRADALATRDRTEVTERSSLEPIGSSNDSGARALEVTESDCLAGAN